PFAELQAALPGVYREGLEEMGLAELKALTARGKAEPREKDAIIDLLQKATGAGPYVLRREAGESLAQLGQTQIPAPGRAPRPAAQPPARRWTPPASSCSAPANRGRWRSAPRGGRSPSAWPARRRRSPASTSCSSRPRATSTASTSTASSPTSSSRAAIPKA